MNFPNEVICQVQFLNVTRGSKLVLPTLLLCQQCYFEGLLEAQQVAVGHRNLTIVCSGRLSSLKSCFCLRKFVLCSHQWSFVSERLIHLPVGTCVIGYWTTWSTHHLGLLGGSYNLSGELSANSLLMQDFWGATNGLYIYVPGPIVLQRVTIGGGVYTASGAAFGAGATISCEDSSLAGSTLQSHYVAGAAAWDVMIRNCTGLNLVGTNIQVRVHSLPFRRSVFCCVFFFFVGFKSSQRCTLVVIFFFSLCPRSVC
jgi:hypothetical protein